jgi:hypothetical protein
MTDEVAEALYAERNAVVLALARAGHMLGWPVGVLPDPRQPGWPVVYVDTPEGQASWHMRAADVPPWLPEYPGEWDAHSPEEKYARLRRFAGAPA